MSIKTPKAPTMTDYKSAAQASRGEKLKALAGGGPVTQAAFPIRPPIVAPLRSSAPSFGAKKPSIPGLAAGGGVQGREQTSVTHVIRGAAAEREMARMEKEAKTAGNRPKPRKG
jgi:hypothetical protein